MGVRRCAPQPVEQRNRMSPDPKSPPLPADVQDASRASRRSYTAPHLKRLGSVRDLTLGSPKGGFTDGAKQKKVKM
jgi:hypothetical protein